VRQPQTPANTKTAHNTVTVRMVFPLSLEILATVTTHKTRVILDNRQQQINPKTHGIPYDNTTPDTYVSEHAGGTGPPAWKEHSSHCH